MRCASCEFDNPDGMKFCGGCGSPLAAVCASCGADLPAGFKFCGQCGTAVGAAPKPSRPSEERRHLSVMFCDLVDSTPLSQALDPEEYLALVREYQQEVGRCVDEWRGHIAQYLGDGVLIYFGYPRALEDDAYRAVQSGLAIISAIEQLSVKLERVHGTRIQVRIGIHTGLVVAGSIGAGERTDKLALGSTPNVAARVQSIANPGEVMISQATYDIVHRLVVAESVGPHELKGVAEPVTIYRATSRHRDLETVSEAFVGRNHELGTLTGSLHSTQDGDGQWVLLRGEAGIGKSRLLSEFKRRATQEAQWMTLRCSAYHENVDLYPLIEMMKRRIGLSDGASIENQREVFSAWLDDAGVHDAESRGQLGLLLDLQHGERSPRTQDRRKGFAALANWLQRAAQDSPVVLAMEDAHWADPSTLDFLAQSVERLRGSRVMVLMTSRPSFDPAWPLQRNHQLIELTRMSEEDARDLVQSRFEQPLPEPVLNQIVERADGIPLFLEELARGASAAAGSVDLERFVPHSLQDALMSRIDALGEAKEVAQFGALLGRSFSVGMLSAASGRDAEQLGDWVVRVVDSGLVQRLGSGRRATLRFRHSLIQDTAYESLLRSQRREIHGQIARTIEQRFPELAESEPHTLGRHLEGAGRTEEAAQAFAQAGDKAAHRLAYVEAMRAYERSLALLALLPDTVERARKEFDVLAAMANPVQAQEGYGSDSRRRLMDRMKDLRAQHGDIGSQFQMLTEEWGFHTMRGHREEANRYAQEVLEHAELSGKPTELVAGHFVVGSNHFYSGRFEAAQTHLLASLDTARGQAAAPSRKDFGHAFLARLVRSWCLSLQGYPDQASELLEGTLKAAEAAGAAFGIVQCLSWMCFGDLDMRREPAVLLHRLGRALELCDEHGMTRWGATATVLQRCVLYETGADDSLEASVLHLKGTSDHVEVTSGYSIVRTVDALLSRNRMDLAWNLIEMAEEISASNLGVFHLPELHRVRGIAHAREQDVAASLQAFERGIDLARDWAAPTQELRALVDLSLLLPEEAPRYRTRLETVLHGFTEGREEPLLKQAAALI